MHKFFNFKKTYWKLVYIFFFCCCGKTKLSEHAGEIARKWAGWTLTTAFLIRKP